MSNARVKGSPLFRGADVKVGSVDTEKRTATLLFSTGAKGKRSSFFGSDWNEELAVEPAAMRMGRLNAGAPLLANHDSYSLDSVIGVVERAYIQDGAAYADVRFSARADVDPILQDVASGILRNVSVGYRVYQWEDVSDESEDLPTYRATDWEPYEVSLVPIGFDAKAQVRSGATATEFDMEVISKRSAPELTKRDIMPDTQQQPAAPAQPQIDAEQIRAEAVKAERVRTVEIQKLVRTAKLDDAFAAELVASGTDINAARAAVIDQWAKVGESQGKQRNVHRIEVGDQDERKTRHDAAVNALMHRANPKLELTEAARQFRGLTVLEMGRSFLEVAGESTRGLDRHEVASRIMSFRTGYNSTSDFPNVLANVANKTLLANYDQLAARQTWRPLAKIGYAPDFKTMRFTRLGEMPKLEQVPEGGEIKRGTLGDTAETATLATYSKIFAITREAIINDDLNAFAGLPGRFGLAAARLESDLAWSVVTTNANMSDGNALFSSTHTNLAATPSVISVASLGLARAAMRTQKGLSKLDPLNITPKYLIVPAALETVADQFVSSAMLANQNSAVNPFASRLQVIAEARLDAASAVSWYVFADPADGVDTFQMIYLEGQPGPKVETDMGFSVNGFEVKVTHDVCAKSIDWRGMYKNAGA